MRSFLVLVLVGASACAGRAARSTLPTEYTCGDIVVHRDANGISAVGSEGTPMSWRDDDGAHYVSFPLGTTDLEAVEYVIPDDPHADAVRRVYDTSRGSSTADWRVVTRHTCMARGGYTDALARFMNGETIDQVQVDLSMADRDEARGLVYRAIKRLQKRYIHEH